MSKYQVTRTVRVIQTIAIKANSNSEAIEASRKTKFKEWSTLDNKKRSDYVAVKLAA